MLSRIAESPQVTERIRVEAVTQYLGDLELAFVAVRPLDFRVMGKGVAWTLGRTVEHCTFKLLDRPTHAY